MVEAPTRLVKLVQIIQSGSGLGIRKSAGKQIAQLVAETGTLDSCQSVLNLLMKPLTSKQWDARLAAAFAMEQVLHAYSQFATEDPNGVIHGEPADFDLEIILDQCPELLASGGTEFDIDSTSLNRHDFLKQQRKNMSQSLGLGDGMGMDDLTQDLVADEDLAAGCRPTAIAETAVPKEFSAREKAMMRRQAKLSAKREREASIGQEESSDKLGLVPMADFTGNAFKDILDGLQSIMVNPNWFVRNGAVLGLRMFFSSGLPWTGPQLLDLAHRALAVLALDRFDDFNGDQVVAPVRESTAQLLSTLIGWMSKDEALDHLVKEIFRLASNQSKWQVRLAGFLALKYSLSLLTEAVSPYCNEIFVLCFSSLAGSGDDDVIGVASQILALLNEHGQISDGTQVDQVTQSILDALALADESSTTVMPLLSLLAALFERQKECKIASIDTILSFLSHPSSDTRLAAFSILKLVCEQVKAAIDEESVYRLCFQSVILEDNDHVRDLALSILYMPRFTNHQTVASRWNVILRLLLNPIDCPFRKELFLFYRPGQGLVSEPAPHEIGFKEADMMLLDANRCLASRRLACKAFEQLLKAQPSIQIPSVLGSQPVELALMILAWIGSAHLISCNLENLSNRTKACILSHSQTLDILDPGVQAILIESLCQEPIEGLQADSAQKLAETLADLMVFDQYILKGPNPTVKRGILKLLASMKDPWASLSARLDAFIESSDPLQQHDATFGLTAIYLEGHCGNANRCQEAIMKALSSSKAADYYQPVASLVSLFRNPQVERYLKEKALLALLANAKKDRDLGLPTIQAFSGLSDGLEEDLLVPLAPIMIPPILERMSGDPDAGLRQMAANCFAKLVRLVAIKAEASSSFLTEELQAAYVSSSSFLAQLTGDQNRIQDYRIPVTINAELRPYQQAGVNWMMFLRRHGLHGVLSDDMGLGKTLQTLSVLASDRHEAGPEAKPSLVVCPSSLLGHWVHEAELYCPSLVPVVLYAGPPGERRKLTMELGSAALVVTSYEIVRNDLELFADHHWSYVVLDEGHIIRNAKTKAAQAVKSLRSDHRLLLSGTPIQNNVVELWALFHFLMPGFLGTEADFMERYGKPILAVQPNVNNPTAGSKGASSNGADFELAEAKLKALHKQVLPFLLRRMKQDVLKDLPPKIIQDYECEPSGLQRLLLNDLALQSGLREELEGLQEGVAKADGSKMHIFAALQYMRKLCVHPALVCNAQHPLWPGVQQEMTKLGLASLDHISLAPKLVMLKELLQECGLGGICDGGLNDESVHRHRVLLFAQQKSTLDLVAKLVLSEMPSLSYLRIDGSVEARARFDLAHRFNADPSIGLLMLTTRVGGLGLNLTGADTVIFLEHDWNPQADLQAMDRAHRLGQKRVVNVYRLVLRGTIEERILGLQAWKKRVAGTVVTQQNANTEEMEQGDLLDLFTTSAQEGQPASKRAKQLPGGQREPKGLSSWIDKIAMATDDQALSEEYAQEFDLGSFFTSLKQGK